MSQKITVKNNIPFFLFIPILLFKGQKNNSILIINIIFSFQKFKKKKKFYCQSVQESNAVKLNFYPQMIPTRNKEWGWNLQNPFVIFTSSPNEEWNKSNHPCSSIQPLEDNMIEKKYLKNKEKLFDKSFSEILFYSPELLEEDEGCSERVELERVYDDQEILFEEISYYEQYSSGEEEDIGNSNEKDD